MAGSVSRVDLGELERVVRDELDDKFSVRELALRNCRKIIRGSANAIRALHREEFEQAQTLLDEVRTLVGDTEGPLAAHQDIFFAGFYYDAVKEFAEARITEALVRGFPLPLPSDLGIPSVPYLNGLGEAVGELRRRLLDQLRQGKLDDAEQSFADMETIHGLLAALDYPDGMTSGLRRTTDVARSLIERSRADLTATIVQERLRERLDRSLQ